MKEKIIELLESTNRQGMENLIGHIKSKTDFFTAPASSRYHGAYHGGLAEHSYNVYKALLSFAAGKYPQDSIIICGLLHDLCKTNFYKESTRNVKNETTGQWEKVPYFAVEDANPLGHGEKSVIILQQFIPLHPFEIYAIRWHMGGFDDSVRGYAGAAALSAAFEKCQLAVMLHMADLAATYLMDGKEG